MKKILLIMLVALLGFSQMQAKAPFGKKTGIREIILVKFKKDVSPAQRKELDAFIKELKSNAKPLRKWNGENGWIFPVPPKSTTNV